MTDEKKTLRLVQGGRPQEGSEIQDWDAKLKELREIEKVLRFTRNANFGPRGGFAMLCGVLAGALVVGGERLLVYCGVWVDGGIATLLSIFVFVATLLAVGKWSSKPRTYTEVLDSLLMRYDPVSADEYRWLQEQFRMFGQHADMVVDWLTKERRAIAIATGRPARMFFTDPN
jgi:hypothetical protein